jgi:hypothetical protein
MLWLLPPPEVGEEVSILGARCLIPVPTECMDSATARVQTYNTMYKRSTGSSYTCPESNPSLVAPLPTQSLSPNEPPTAMRYFLFLVTLLGLGAIGAV